MDTLVTSIVPVYRTIDDAVDESESLPFRNKHKLIEVELPL
jgi:hypothetical protein